jgi:hypothetical protein
MDDVFWLTLAMHFTLAILLFISVNWIGKHAVDFGYVSTSLFEEPNESVVLNFFIRALSPAVFIILFSSAAVAVERPELRIGIINVVLYYYLFRAGVIFLLNRQRLISWPRYVGHSISGIAFAALAYHYLILPNRSLIPDLETAGNELWLALLAFLYAVANKITLPSGPGGRRRNSFVSSHYYAARTRFGEKIDSKVSDQLLKLIVYSVLIYEDYCRPPAIRALERMAVWKESRTTGIMQVAAKEPLTDIESVSRGVDILLASWEKYSSEEHLWSRIRESLSDYNMDDDYIQRVQEVMEILAKRVDPNFREAYDSIWN